MEYKDYYRILGVDRKAKEDEIKRVYRKLALQYHPDRNPGDKQAEERFKEINEAYQVLSDPTKRQRYNQLGESYTSWQQRGGPPGGFNWEDWTNATPGGVRVEVGDIDDILGGGFSDFFRSIFGGMPETGTVSPGRGRTAHRRPRAARPAYEQEVTISLREAYQGSTRLIEVDGRRLEVKIPAGASNGTRVRVAEAIPGGPGGERGDLYLVIQVSDDPKFERKGINLYTDVTVDLYTAVLGGEVTVPTITGNVMLTIPPGTQPGQTFRLAGRGMPNIKDPSTRGDLLGIPGQTFRLAGRGMPNIKDPSTRGDLLVRVKVSIPRNITTRQRELFEQLASTT